MGRVRSLLKVFRLLTKKQLRTCFALVVAMFIGAALEAGGIALLYPLIAVISQPDFLARHEAIAKLVAMLGVTTHKAFIIFCALSLLVFFVLKNLFVFLETRAQIFFSINNQCDYTKRLFAYYLKQPYLFHVNTNSSILLNNISQGSGAIFQNILINTLALFTECSTALIIWATILVMDPILALTVLLIMGPLILAILNTFRKKVTKQGKIQRDFYATYTKHLYQGLGAIKETKVMQTEDFFTEEFARTYTEYSNARRDYLVVEKIPRALIELAGIGGFLALVIVKIALGATPASLIPILGVLALAAVRLMPSANRIMQYFNQIKFNMPYMDSLFNVFMTIKNEKDDFEISGEGEKYTPLPFERSIEVRNLTFKYPSSEKIILDDVSFTIKKGDFVGIVGPTGAGKTTFVDVLLGLLTPSSGDIFIDGKSMRENTHGWLENVSYVPQTIYLVDGTIRENIALGVKAQLVTDERIAEALKMAQLWDFVESLPQKANTKVGELGAKLSGGQRQRIGIARALYKKPRVLVLDEATSALDNDTERAITDTILSLKGQITIISIAHRLSTLASCDFKLKIDGGKVSKDAGS